MCKCMHLYKFTKSKSGYYSYTIENPSSAINDGEFTKDVFIAARKSINARTKRDTDDTAMVVHVTIQGQETVNVYSLESMEGDHSGAGNFKTMSVLLIITIVIHFINF